MTSGLLTTTETEDQVEGRLLLDIVVGKGATILQLLPRKDQTLLVWGDALLVLDLSLHIVNGVGTLNLQGDGLASQCLDEDLHPTPQAEHQVESALLLDIVISKGAAILKLLASKDEPLLVRRDALLVLDFRLYIVNGVRRLHLKGNSLASQGLDEDLHPTPQSEHQVESALLLYFVISKGTAVLELLASKDEPLLVWGDALLILDLGLDIVNGVRRLNLQGDSLPGQGLHENLHASPETEHQVEGALLLDVVVSKRAPVLELLASEDEPLLVRGDTLFVLDLGLDIINGVRRLHLKGDGLAGEGLNKDLHLQKNNQAIR